MTCCSLLYDGGYYGAGGVDDDVDEEEGAWILVGTVGFLPVHALQGVDGYYTGGGDDPGFDSGYELEGALK